MNQAVEQNISERLRRGHLTGRTVLSTFRMIDESSRESPGYTDNRYAPFYYILGQELQAKSLLEFGFGIGIASGCYVRGCRTAEHVLAFQEVGKSYYSPRMGIHNLKNYFRGVLDVHVGRIHDEAFALKAGARKWDLAIMNEESDYGTLMEHMEFAWDALGLDGTLVMDRVSSDDQCGKAYSDFCRRKGRRERLFQTKYGVGVITK